MEKSNILYPEDVVLAMTMEAYKAGFDGPLELAEEACLDIIFRSPHKQSDLELMNQMQQRDKKKVQEDGHKFRLPRQVKKPPVQKQIDEWNIVAEDAPHHAWIPPAPGQN